MQNQTRTRPIILVVLVVGLLVMAAAAAVVAVLLTRGDSSSSSSSSSSQNDRPNVVFILTDDQGYHDIGYRGSDMVTPHLDSLAREGVRLENYYVQPVCSPSRAQLMTGRYQIHTGLQHHIVRTSQPYGLPLEFPTLPDVLKQQGYTTHAVGKWHLGFFKQEYMPLARGFETYYGGIAGYSDHYDYDSCDQFRTFDFEIQRFRDGSPRPLPPTDRYCGYSLYDNNAPATDGNGTYSTHLYTQKAVEIVERAAQSDKPLFLYLAYTAPHSPMQVPEEYLRDLPDIPNPARKIYAAMMKALDEGVKNVTDALKNSGLWDNTVLIYSSDNGGEASVGGNNWPLRGTKHTLWEGGIKTIGFVNSPLIGSERKGKVSTELMHISDWFPTISAMAGISLNASLELDGVNQWPMIRDGKPSPRTEILHNIDILAPQQGSPLYNDTFDTRVRAAIRVGDYKLLTGDPGFGEYLPRTLSAEGYTWNPFWHQFNESANNVWLFDLAQDPSETEDLSDRMPGKVRELLDKLTAYNDTALTPWYPESDRNADPARHGGVWVPWE